jgi:phospholipid transport system substrate-binding protein
MIAIAAIIISATQAQSSPLDDVKKTVDEVVYIVTNKEMIKNDVKRRQALKKSISTIFDYSEMAKRSLGKHWNQLTSEERTHFTILFTTLLENSYAGKLESFSNEKIIYIKEVLDGDHAEIKSKIVSVKRDEYTLDYRLIKLNDRWMVYDIIIEGVGVISNYRSQFNRIIGASGYAGLVKKMEVKISDFKTL